MLKTNALLQLTDGTEYEGFIFGYPTNTSGELVFNTGMVGYPETMSDPSYFGQIIVFTYPLIGNYGVPSGTKSEDNLLLNFESEKIQCRAIVVSEYSDNFDHSHSNRSLNEWMNENQIVGLHGIDTRALTKKLRNDGTFSARIIIENTLPSDFIDPNNQNLVEKVSTKSVITYNRSNKRIVLVDCGVKNNIINAFLNRDITVIRVPFDFNFNNIECDGILISNGPGDPLMCDVTINHTRTALERHTPILGICLGSQILGLAAGAVTYKLKYGHRGLNQPVLDPASKRCYITSQNHGYAIDARTLPQDWQEWFVNENDDTNEGILHISKPFFGAQFHPEASPGPDDSEFIFDMFVRAIENNLRRSL